MTKCHVCFRHCDLKEGDTGFCGARIGLSDRVAPANYGHVTSIALDPIEKKPLHRFHPGSRILSVGSYGCNLRCPFCQNNEISWGEEAKEYSVSSDIVMPDQIVAIAEQQKDKGNIGVAFTYNEPLIGYEFVRDTAKLAHSRGLKNVIVSNGTAELSVLDEISPYIDAMNIDLKCFDPGIYSRVLGGNMMMTLEFIKEAVKTSHVELTCLIVPGVNDSEKMMREMTAWIVSLKDGKNIPLHVSRFFPCFHMTDRSATPVSTVYKLAEVAGETLDYVYTGNC
ncbi:MAG: AmmeMemoRadiSam system radical SAM enzyme [Clostridiales bacterium]|nr:AmmeMemoRadiSam system radical SAM enzyme [Clostridiales bacterium]